MSAGVLSIASLYANTTGARLGSLRLGMKHSAVRALLGQPDIYVKAGETEGLTYSHRKTYGWRADREDYSILLTAGLVTQYGVGIVRSGARPDTLSIVYLC